MATKDEIQGWIWNAQAKYAAYKQTVETCDKQIARLEPVYKELCQIKSDFRGTRKSTEQVFRDKGIWRGDKYTSFCNAGDELDAFCGEYYNRLDAAQDAVNEKIGELKAKKKELIPILGGLLAQIEQWRVDIENALN